MRHSLLFLQKNIVLIDKSVSAIIKASDVLLAVV